MGLEISEHGEDSGMTMRMFKRYVDDSNQAALVPPVGTKYDSDLRRIVQYEEETNERIDECEDSRLARVLREIANHVMEGIDGGQLSQQKPGWENAHP